MTDAILLFLLEGIHVSDLSVKIPYFDTNIHHKRKSCY